MEVDGAIGVGGVWALGVGSHSVIYFIVETLIRSIIDVSRGGRVGGDAVSCQNDGAGWLFDL